MNNKELSWFIDQLKQLETGEGYISPADLNKKMESILSTFKGSSLDGYIIADHLATLANSFKDEHTDNAHTEFLMLHGDEKGEHKGVEITPAEGYFKYEFESDSYIDKYNNELSTLSEQMQPYKIKEKTLKDSIKNREKILISENKAKLVSSTKSLKFKRK